MRHLTLLLIITGLSVTLTAQQTLDILTISGRYGLPQDYKDTYTGQATESGTYIGITAGIPISDRTIIPININHFYFNVQGDPAIPDGIINPIILNGFILRTGLRQKLANGDAIQILFAPRFMTDFKNVDGNSFQFGGVVMYQKRFHERLSMGFGAMFHQELFGPYLVPLVDINWKVSDRWSIAGMLPITARISYQVNDNLATGFYHSGLSTTYYLGDEAYAGDYIERLCIDLSLFGRQRLFGNFYLEG
ncbi:MAG: hypothetical protein KAT15_25960, partial [Bacteroidales bacterium]|nr:hypothetical protein [Bacteroidales bacterium]